VRRTFRRRPETEAFSLVLTHHSLAPLGQPMAGLEEMLRVAKSRVAFFEPARGVNEESGACFRAQS